MATNEAKVISAICKNKDIHLVLGDDPELFGGYQDIFEFVRGYYLRHKSVPEKELIEERFGDVDLPDLGDKTTPTAFYVSELRSDFVKSRMQEIMMKAAGALDKDSAPAVLDKLTTSLAKLGKYTNSVRDVNIADGEYAMEHFKKLRDQSDGTGSPGISTGFKSIDSAYSTGLAGGHSIVLMGYTGRGKSMWSALLAVKAWLQGYKVMVISLEMAPEEYMERVLAMMSNGMFKISDMARGDINEDDFRTWSKKELANSTDFIVVSNQGIADVTPNVIQAKIDTHQPDLVILDYLQLMNDNGKTQAMTPRMLNLSREIKMLAVSNNIPVISITAVTDEDGDKRDSPPVLSQVAWSKGIEYDANLVIAIHRHDDSDIVEVVCRKNRHGGMFSFFFDVDFNAGIWREKFDLNDA